MALPKDTFQEAVCCHNDPWLSDLTPALYRWSWTSLLLVSGLGRLSAGLSIYALNELCPHLRSIDMSNKLRFNLL